MDKNKLKVEYVKIDDLHPAEYNPRGITEHDRYHIQKSLQKFGFAEPIIVNKNPDRLNVIVGGHQRVKVAKEDLGMDEVPCVFVNLSLEDEKELNIRLNKNLGRWDLNALQEFFDKDFLKMAGFEDKDLEWWMSDFQKKFNSITNKNCDMPIIPKFSEKYDAVIIISTNTVDTTFLETALKIGKEKSYKNTRTGKAMVIDVEHFKKALNGE